MQIINLKQKHLFIYSSKYGNSSFVVKVPQLGQIWLFNCSEGCQHILARKKIKVSQIAKIIITDLNIGNISGLLGLLSSLSLNASIKKIDIYGPKGLVNYLFLGRKYSQTNFRYTLLIHDIKTSVIAESQLYQFYAFIRSNIVQSFYGFIFMPEKPGRFNLLQALQYNVPLGFLCGKLKMGNNFILPDGFKLYGRSFINSYYLGTKVSFLSSYFNRLSFEVTKNSKVMFIDN